MRKSAAFPLYLVLFECLVYCANDVPLPAIPHIQAFFHVAAKNTGFFMIPWLIGASCFHIPLGFCVERWGYRNVWWLGVAIFVFGLLMVAGATSLYGLYVGRLLQGCALSSVVVAGYAWFHECFETQEAVGYLAWMNAVRLVPAALGAFVGVWVLHHGAWQWIFCILALLVMLDGWLVARYMPQKRQVRPKQAANPVRYWALLQQKTFMLPALIMAQNASMAFIWLTHSPWLLLVQEGLSDYTFACMQGGVFLGFGMGSWVLNRWHVCWSLRRWVFSGLLWSTAAIIILCMISLYYPDSIVAHVVGVGCLFASFAIMRSTLQRLMIDAVPGGAAKKMALMTTVVRLVAVCLLWLCTLFVINWYVLSMIFLAMVAFQWLLWRFYNEHQWVPN